jgi:hypothetical protein
MAGQKNVTIALRITEKEKKLIDKRIGAIAEALGTGTTGAYGITTGAVIRYCMWESLGILPAESVNKNLLKLKKVV